MRLRSDYRERIRFRSRVAHVGIAVGVGFLVLLVQLIRLQIVHGEDFARQSRENSIRLLELPAPRGIIYDAYGRPLVDNRPAFFVDFIPGEARDPVATLTRLSRYLDLDATAVLHDIDRGGFPPFALHRLARDLALEEVLPIEEHQLVLPGVLVSAEPQRRVLHGPLCAHIVGTIGEIDSNELERYTGLGYDMGDWIGKTGVERPGVGETTLRGVDGELHVQVYADAPPTPRMLTLTSEGEATVRKDIRGRQVRTLDRVAPVPGNDIVLTLDLTMQQAADDALGDNRGAVVVMDTATGAIRAMVSHPSFDPNVFVRPARVRERSELLRDPAHPMLNRAVQSYAPGSTSKIVMTYAGLSEGYIGPGSTTHCPGHYTLGRRYHCWKAGGHGKMVPVHALAFSCDVFFYALGHQMGIDAVEQAFRDLGLGQRTGFDLPGESPGLVPGRVWKQTQRHLSDRTWYAGETLNVVIGQGQMLATPLQLARMLAAFANGGYLVHPHVIDRHQTPEGRVILRTAPQRERISGWDEAAAERVREGLRQAVRARKPFFGTAWRLKADHFDVIGKTGTAQVVRLHDAMNRRTTEETPYEERDHAWFICSVMDRNPHLVIAVFVEHGGHASETAVPVAQALLDAIYPQDEAPAGTEVASADPPPPGTGKDNA